jgi:hypothetical protein
MKELELKRLEKTFKNIHVQLASNGIQPYYGKVGSNTWIYELIVKVFLMWQDRNLLYFQID